MEIRASTILHLTLFLYHLGSRYVESVDNMNLEVVQVLFRHGERTPLAMEYNILEYTDLDVYKPYGLGQLTNTGKMQAYKIGQMLKERYKDFLNNTYDPQSVYARSSENDRTRTSLQLVLAGLFPPTDEFRWNPKLNWMPIPYRYVPQEYDALLKIQDTAKFMQYYHEVFKTSWGREKLASYEEIYNLLDKLGIEISKTDLIDLATVYNVLFINERLNISLPDWCTDEIKKKFEPVIDDFHESFSHTHKLKRINGGPLIRTFINNMNLNGLTGNPKKLYLYSGHDMNVGAVAIALNLKGYDNLDFCSTLIVEKLRDSKNQVYVRLLHWNGIEEELKTARIGNCEELCPIERFLELAGDVIPSDEELFSFYDKYDTDYIKKFLP